MANRTKRHSDVAVLVWCEAIMTVSLAGAGFVIGWHPILNHYRVEIISVGWCGVLIVGMLYARSPHLSTTKTIPMMLTRAVKTMRETRTDTALWRVLRLLGF